MLYYYIGVMKTEGHRINFFMREAKTINKQKSTVESNLYIYTVTTCQMFMCKDRSN